MHRATREGPTRRPLGFEWPLDGILVGVGTLRVLRELYVGEPDDFGHRAWDLAAWCGVTTQGAGKALERLGTVGFVYPSDPPPGRAPSWWLDRGHPLCRPLGDLFRAEWQAVRLDELERAGRAVRLDERLVSRRTTRDPSGA